MNLTHPVLCKINLQGINDYLFSPEEEKALLEFYPNATFSDTWESWRTNHDPIPEGRRRLENYYQASVVSDPSVFARALPFLTGWSIDGASGHTADTLVNTLSNCLGVLQSYVARDAHPNIRQGDIDPYDDRNQPNDGTKYNEKCSVVVPDLGVFHVRQVAVVEDYCTNALQDHLDRGWHILAICPQPARRPDYVLGHRERNARL